MPNVGPLELVVVLVIALIVLGPKRLPEVGRSLGRGIREFKDSLEGERRDEDDEVYEDDEVGEDGPKALAPAAATAPPPPDDPKP